MCVKAHQYSKIKILRFDESLYACNAPFFKRKFYKLIGIHLEQSPIISYRENTQSNHVEESIYNYVILECSPFNYIDTVGVKLLIQVCLKKIENKIFLCGFQIFNDLKKRGIVLYLSECRCKFIRKDLFRCIYNLCFKLKFVIPLM